MSEEGETREFELVLQGEGGHYIATPRVGKQTGLGVTFTLPEDLRPEGLAATLHGVFRDATPAFPRGTTAPVTLRKLGEQLSGLVLKDDVARRLRDQRRSARAGRLLIRLNIQSPELAELPWELLLDTEQVPVEFLGTSRGVAIVRAVPGEVRPPQTIVPPLRVKVMVASPKGHPQLALDKEVELLERALSTAGSDGRVVVERVTTPTRGHLYEALRPGTRPVHVFHFAGHGAFPEGNDEGEIILCDDGDGADPCPASEFAINFAQTDVAFVVLNCCDSAAGGKAGLFTAVGSRVAAAGVPAVLAMRRSIEDEDAIRLAALVYTQIASGATVAEAVAEARLAMRTEGHAWATPVLYLSDSDPCLVPRQARTSPDAPVPPLALPESPEQRKAIFLGIRLREVPVLGRSVEEDRAAIGDVLRRHPAVAAEVLENIRDLLEDERGRS